MRKINLCQVLPEDCVFVYAIHDQRPGDLRDAHAGIALQASQELKVQPHQGSRLGFAERPHDHNLISIISRRETSMPVQWQSACSNETGECGSSAQSTQGAAPLPSARHSGAHVQLAKQTAQGRLWLAKTVAAWARPS